MIPAFSSSRELTRGTARFLFQTLEIRVLVVEELPFQCCGLLKSTQGNGHNDDHKCLSTRSPNPLPVWARGQRRVWESQWGAGIVNPSHILSFPFAMGGIFVSRALFFPMSLHLVKPPSPGNSAQWGLHLLTLVGKWLRPGAARPRPGP